MPVKSEVRTTMISDCTPSSAHCETFWNDLIFKVTANPTSSAESIVKPPAYSKNPIVARPARSRNATRSAPARASSSVRTALVASMRLTATPRSAVRLK